MSQAPYETTAARVEAETSTAPLAKEVHQTAEQAHDAAKAAAAVARSEPSHPASLPADKTTTASNAESQAPNAAIAEKIHQTAQHVQGVAEHAASTAHTKGPGVTGNTSDAFVQLGTKAAETRDAAVAEGHKSVDSATATGAHYLEQAMNLAGSAMATAQSYLPNGVPSTSANASPATSTRGSASSAKATALSTLETAQQYLSSAQQAAQPYISGAQQAAQPHVDAAKSTLQSYLPGSQKPNDVASSTAPLESGPHTVGTPYPPTMDKTKGDTVTSALKVAENERK
ncbi:hypothetical protein EVG20_g203 [Dentipellis fragilis]|uniref:Uncharacterized protein n=1 Tax=Dentipellis fragilis TaxID=205917 RepID=A0A4Y9ZH35_9AGAM|nr:hypothetical protein EVG20_g203 [Dentipellis fragilis]